MKKIICFLSGITLLLTSCSSDDNSQGNLITSMKYVGKNFSTDFRNHVFNFEYIDGNKLVRISDGQGAKTEFTYTGNLISKIDVWEYLNQEPNFSRSFSLQYDDSGRLDVISVEQEGSIDTVIKFTYIDLFHINYTHTFYSYMHSEGIETTGVIICDENDILKKTTLRYGESGEYLIAREIDYVYDNKKHPYSSIRGFKDLKLYNAFFGSIFTFNYNINDGDGFAPNWGTTHNVVSFIMKRGFDLEIEDSFNLFSYEYGNNDFPKKCSKVLYDDEDLHIECTYY